MGCRERVVGARLAGATPPTPVERGHATRLRAKPTRNADIALKKGDEKISEYKLINLWTIFNKYLRNKHLYFIFYILYFL